MFFLYFDISFFNDKIVDFEMVILRPIKLHVIIEASL